MKTSKFYTVLLILFLSFNSVFGQVKLINKEYTLPVHPRLLLLKEQEKRIILNIKKDDYWRSIHQNIINDCEKMLDLQPIENIKTGRRLLDKSRECIRRVFLLAYAYRITKDDKYLKRAEKEMLAVAAFDDWNPSHFLDVGEMTFAMTIGYDWLYDNLQPESRLAIKEAILKKGIEPSLNQKYNGWLSSSSNWNQVCNTGIAYGALATYEDHPEISGQIIERAIDSIELPMKQYAPDGAYPEGYSYWGYGTTYNVLFISAMETAFKTDFGLSTKLGFLKTANYLENMTGSSNKSFNYSDASSNTEFNPAMIWFANKSKDPSLLYVEKQRLTSSIPIKNRFLPAALVWGLSTDLVNTPAPKKLMWVGNGDNPVSLYRTSWTNPNAIFIGFKGGSPSVSHGHMDVGSFVMEANGINWAIDLGMQEYESLESKGIDLWNMKQNAERWKVFRYNNLAHNTLTVNNEYQKVGGYAPLISHSETPSFMNTIANLSDLYGGNVSKIKRGVAIIEKKYVVVQDEIKTGKDSIVLRWSMVTPASVKIISQNLAELKKDGKTLWLQVEGAKNLKLKTWSTEPTTNFDVPNPNTQIVGYEVKLPANSKQIIKVTLNPQKKFKKKKAKLIKLEDWPKS